MPTMHGLLYNQDCTDFFYNKAIKEGVDGGALLDAYVDVIAGAGVTTMLINTNARKTNYRSGVWESFWEGYDPEGPDDQPLLRPLPEAGRAGWRRMIHSMWALHQQGVDYPARIIARCRTRGVSPWISLRMNDVHCNDNLAHPFHGRLWREEKYFRGGSLGYFARGLDYGHQEVRDTYRALIVETLQRYDLDGLELDFMREPYLFQEGKEREGAAILREWLRGVRRLVHDASVRRGHPIWLGVRVPSRVEVAQGWGLEAVAWAKEGLIDLVVATPRWSTLEYDMPLAQWHRALEGTGVTLAGGLEILNRPMPAGPARSVTPEHAAGAATAVLGNGADAVYLFNYFPGIIGGNGWTPESYAETLRAMSSLEKLARLPRRTAVTWRDITGPGEQYRAPLPAEGTELRFELPTGPVPEGAAVTVELALDPPQTPAPEVRVNGVAAPAVAAQPEQAPRLYRVPTEAVAGRARTEIAISGAAGQQVKVVAVELRIAPAK